MQENRRDLSIAEGCDKRPPGWIGTSNNIDYLRVADGGTIGERGNFHNPSAPRGSNPESPLNTL
jgi:hypothetical protein